jgi:hypothetical protein
MRSFVIGMAGEQHGHVALQGLPRDIMHRHHSS